MPNPQEAQHYIEGVNYFVENMQLHSHVGSDGYAKVELGTPVAAAAAGIIAAASVATTAAVTPNVGSYNRDVMGKYGRNVVVALSGAGTPTITVRGRDYLGQPVREDIVAAGATPVAGKKAFKYVDSVTPSVGVAATTISVGFGDVFGLPFAADQLVQEAVNNQATANAGTFTASVKTAQTATTGDPRGTYAPAGANAANGVRSYSLVTRCDKTMLHGVRHFG